MQYWLNGFRRYIVRLLFLVSLLRLKISGYLFNNYKRRYLYTSFNLYLLALLKNALKSHCFLKCWIILKFFYYTILSVCYWCYDLSLYTLKNTIWQVMLAVWFVLLFCGRFPIYYPRNHQRSLDWSIILDVSPYAAIYARHAAGFRNTPMFSGWMCRISNGRIKSRLVLWNYLIN